MRSIPFPGSLALLTFRELYHHLTINTGLLGKYQPDGEAYPSIFLEGYPPNKLSYVAPPRRGKVCNGRPMVASHWGTYRFWCIFSLYMPYGVYFLTPIFVLLGNYGSFMGRVLGLPIFLSTCMACGISFFHTTVGLSKPFMLPRIGSKWIGLLKKSFISFCTLTVFQAG